MTQNRTRVERERVCFLEKEFSESICINPYVLLYLIVNQVDSCHVMVLDLLIHIVSKML